MPSFLPWSGGYGGGCVEVRASVKGRRRYMCGERPLLSFFLSFLAGQSPSSSSGDHLYVARGKRSLSLSPPDISPRCDDSDGVLTYTYIHCVERENARQEEEERPPPPLLLSCCCRSCDSGYRRRFRPRFTVKATVHMPASVYECPFLGSTACVRV